MKQSRYSIVVFEILGIVAFIATFAIFDRSLTDNDLAVVLLMAGIGSFVMAGLFYNYDRPAIADIIPLATGIAGFMIAVVGIGAFHFGLDWAMVATLIGVFAVFSDLCFVRIANR